LADFQALKADALNFVGDGLISFLGLIAIGWRARAPFLQGVFLGLLGLGILATTAYRVLVLNQPEADLMEVFGLMALAVNVAAALVLLPHRHGDANVRAVWLFSRNDALGNIAVVIAAGLVAWPDWWSLSRGCSSTHPGRSRVTPAATFGKRVNCRLRRRLTGRL
jgi:Co/Zn/Cd efflux system component